MVELDCFKIPNDWEYRGEGNCHVVLGLPALKKVLRIRKRDKPKTLLQWLSYIFESFLWWLFNVEVAAEYRDLLFYLNIMRPMLGYTYTSDAKQVKLYREEVNRIEDQISKLRPEFRKHKKLHFGRATLFQDFTMLPFEHSMFELTEHTFAIEIKPKKGWTPFSERSFPECIFCMNQFMKLKGKKITKRSNYCPRDLFSGDEIRMIKAILALVDNPQNNLCIFKDGQKVYDENSAKCEITPVLEDLFQNYSEKKEELLSDFAYLLFQCLTKPFETQPDCSAKLFCKWDMIIQGDSLSKGCILEKILSVQMIDVEGTSYYNKLSKVQNSEWGYVENILKSLDPTKCVKCSLCTLSNTTTTMNEELVLSLYLIAAIANDCSLMVTLKKIRTDNNRKWSSIDKVVHSKFGSFLVNVGVFDLYPKPMSTIRKHVLRNRQLLELYEIMKE
ncbi:inositol-pentakisphosphate 2-kinase [Coccinella septempunctata]|uniref:inositol-pentakisphosphate 2-kinase n=1 Tax=Coccinella septempunctata TaxID=41139 RepID=UPI001D099087|nr:inositol-pentakisphosphate 2-kinase [Coccinella septempunctata]